MQIFALPERIQAIAFDVDRTLYDNDEYAELQITLLIQRLAEERGESVGETRRAIARWRDDYARAHDGAKQSLGNAFLALGIPIDTSVRWRAELIHPSDFLATDPRLRAALDELSVHYELAVVTNNPVSVGEETLRALGVQECFSAVVGLDTTGRSKPAPEPFREVARVLGVPPRRIVSVGDRYDVDIEPALSVGMGGVLVNGVRDVYGLPQVFDQAHRLDA